MDAAAVMKDWESAELESSRWRIRRVDHRRQSCALACIRSLPSARNLSIFPLTLPTESAAGSWKTMPTYEYACEKCGRNFEFFQSMKDKPLTVCPKEVCGGKRWGKGKVKRLLGTGAGLIFKGSGFYITDYRSDGYKAAAKKESEGSKPAATTESKPAAAKPVEAPKPKSETKAKES
jgi:putative FmdB family regulatory protein